MARTNALRCEKSWIGCWTPLYFFRMHNIVVNGADPSAEIMSVLVTAADYIRSLLPAHYHHPEVGIICGSGLQGLADSLQDARTIDYADVPGFPRGSVAGHKQCMKIGRVKDRVCIVFLGRFHGYEGLGASSSVFLVHILAMMEVPNLIITNSSGSVNVEVCRVGDFLVVEDHISFPAMSGFSPLVGPNLAHFGPRFPSLHQAYHPDSYALVSKAAGIAGINTVVIKRGVYCHVGGPAYETPTEVRLLRLLGGAAVGMSTAPEVIAAAHSYQIKKIIVIALITNEPYRKEGEGPTHEEVLAVAAARAIEFRDIILNLVPLM